MTIFWKPVPPPMATLLLPPPMVTAPVVEPVPMAVVLAPLLALRLIVPLATVRPVRPLATPALETSRLLELTATVFEPPPTATALVVEPVPCWSRGCC